MHDSVTVHLAGELKTHTEVEVFPVFVLEAHCYLKLANFLRAFNPRFILAGLSSCRISSVLELLLRNIKLSWKNIYLIVGALTKQLKVLTTGNRQLSRKFTFPKCFYHQARILRDLSSRSCRSHIGCRCEGDDNGGSDARVTTTKAVTCG